MSSGRVVASDQAKAEITGLESDFAQGIADLRSRFARRNAVLTNPLEWDGRHANTYKSQVIPQVEGLLKRWDADVKQLSTQINRILADIMAAGGN
jgi:hypothetical protein